MKEKTISEVMRQMGRRGGKKSLETLTPEERSERARKAAARSAEVRAKKVAEKKGEA